MKTFKLTTLSAALLATMASTQAYANDVNQETADIEVEKIYITGSRIARAEVASSSPITVVTKAQLTNLGISDVSTALRRLPALTGATANNQSSAGANNIQTATLRGIEATNTLILVNGRRLVGSDESGLVDLSSIPFEAISQIEVLKDGASAIYGSDAIAGVINIKTRQRYEGFEVNAHYGQSSKGDAQERKLGLVMGISGEKGSVMIAASSSNNSGWEETDRYMTKDTDQSYLGGEDTSSSTAPNAMLSGFGLPDGKWTVLDANNPSVVVPFDYPTMGYNYRAAQSGANDNKTTSVYVTGDYELNEDTTFFAELSIHDGFVQGNQASPGVDTAYYGDNIDTPDAFKRYPVVTIDEDGNEVVTNYGVGPNQKYNPFGQPGNVARRFSEYGSRIYKSESDILRYTFGLTGIIAEDYDYELVFSKQSAKLVRDGGVQPSIKMIERALSDECETEADPDCVALNVFGPEGSITQEMLDFINVTAPMQTNKNDLMFFQASIAGPVMSLPEGDLMFSSGMEYREEQLSLSVDQAQRTATFDVSWGGSVTPVVSPVREIKEFYLELAAPVFENFDVEAAIRYSQYSDIDENTTNPKLGVNYRPLDNLKFRATYSTGFRAPTMAEMYQGRTSSINTNLYDPCNPNNKEGFVADLAGCAGLNPAFIKNTIQSNDIIGGGNPDLEPEKATNMTLGIVYEPLEDLSFTLDYYDIEQEDVVFASSRYVIDQFVAGNAEYANDVIRSNNGKGYIQTIFSPANNIAARNLSGIDLNAHYMVVADNGDEWRFNLDLTRVTQFDVQATSDEAFEDITGTYSSAFGSIPETKATLQVDWSRNNIRATWDATYNSEIDAGDSGALDATVFHNVQVGYFLEDYDTDVHMGLQNVFDKEPPFFTANLTGTDDNLYSFRGRFIYVGMKTTF
ncbi:TonB-dependent receptor [Thalassotalea ganghwensis]